MKHSVFGRTTAAVVLAATILSAAAAQASAAIVTIEPDDYAAGTVLRDVSPYVTLRVATEVFGVPNVPSTFFQITSLDGDSGDTDYSPTGTRVIGHDGVSFISNSFRIRADFAGVTDSAAFLFQGTSTLSPQTGRLEAYSANGTLLAAAETQPLYVQSTTLSVARPTADIAYVVAYTSAGSFGQFDAFTFNTPVPEPAALGGLAVAAAGLVRRRRRH